VSTRGSGPGPASSGRGGPERDGDPVRPATETAPPVPVPAAPPAPGSSAPPAPPIPPRTVRADRRLPEQDTDIPLPSIPSPRLGGVPRDRAEHRAEIHRRFELLAECEPDSARYRTLRDELIAEHMNYARYVAWILNAWPARDGAEDGIVRRASIREITRPANFAAASASDEPGGCPRGPCFRGLDTPGSLLK